MPITPLSNVLGSAPSAPPLDPLEVEIGLPEAVTVEDGARATELPDGSVIIELEPGKKPKSDKFNANLAEEMSDLDLGRIGSDLIEGIRRDDNSRQEHLQMIAEGMKLLGLVIESNASAAGDSSAPLEGMSTARHPLLLEACQLFQANAMGELLPAAGPVKVRDDRPQKPSQNPMMGHNGGPPLTGPSPFAAPAPPAGLAGAPAAGPAPMPPQAAPPPQPAAPMPQGMPPIGPAMAPSPQPPEEPRDEIAEAFEKDFNHYLTAVAKEYVPDTDQMLFKVGFSGLGVKKVYNCPLRRRPVSESIDIEDFIVSNALTDLSNAGRITHRIKMRPSVLKRMQILGVYRDVALGDPAPSTDANPVDQAKANIAGTEITTPDPRDTDYELYECYCELDLDEFAPAKFKGKGLPLPYRVTLEKESYKILEIRRNWREDDEECLAREFFVDFPYMRAFGFYCIGLLHLLGNTTKALTALWREFIDAGMFANFPGFLYLKGAGRQNTNQFRVAPGSGIGLDSSVADIRQSVMPLPYKSPDAGFVQFVGHIEELGQRLGGTSNTAVAEGRADAPVGTTLALIEQASKPVGAVNKRLHASQAREFALLKDRFRDDPEAFWRFNRRPALAWRKEQFLKALEDYDLVPVSDPNNPTRMHRAAKASWLQQVATAAPGLLDPKKVFLRAAQEMEIDDVEDLLAPPQAPQAPPVDPTKVAEVQHKNAKLQADAAAKAQDAQIDLVKTRMEMENDAADRASKERVAQIDQETERLRLASTFAIHSDKISSAREAMQFKALSDHVGKAAQQMHEIRMAEGGGIDGEKDGNNEQTAP
jgi:hypothetical protein